jgi:hypothetical protein
MILIRRVENVPGAAVPGFQNCTGGIVDGDLSYIEGGMEGEAKDGSLEMATTFPGPGANEPCCSGGKTVRAWI